MASPMQALCPAMQQARWDSWQMVPCLQVLRACRDLSLEDMRILLSLLWVTAQKIMLFGFHIAATVHGLPGSATSSLPFAVQI